MAFLDLSARAILRRLVLGGVLACALGSLAWWHHTQFLPVGDAAMGHFPTTIKYGLGLAHDRIYLLHLLQHGNADYAPLTYLVGGALAAITNFAPWSYSLTLILFTVAALLAAYLLGRRLAGTSFAALLPVLALFAAPTFWSYATSFNLDISMLVGALGILAILLDEKERRSPLFFVGTVALAGALALSKLTVLLCVLPPAAVMLLPPWNPAHRRRVFVVFAMLGFVSWWIAPHFGTFSPELSRVYRMPSDVGLGYWYYPVQLLYVNRQAPLVAGLIVLFFVRLARRNLDRVDLALLVFFLAPFVFYSLAGHKTDRFLFPAYPAFSLWYAHSAFALRQIRWVRWLSAALLATYTLGALWNSYLVFRQVPQNITINRALPWIRGASSPSPQEQKVADALLAQWQTEPRSCVAVQLSSALDSDRIFVLLLLRYPLLAAQARLTITDLNGFGDRPFVSMAKCCAARIWTIGTDWPTLDPGGYSRPQIGEPFATLVQRLDSCRGNYRRGQALRLDESTLFAEFVTLRPEQSAINCLEAERRFLGDLRYSR